MRRWLVGFAVALGLWACGPSQPAPRPMGDPCVPSASSAQAAAACADGLCVALDNASGFCTGPCADDSSCPEGFICQAAGKHGRVCQKLTGCTKDGECPAGHGCNVETGHCYIRVSRTLCSPCQDVLQCPAGGYCFNAVGSGETFCTAPCGSAGECPTGFECKEIPAGKDRELVRQCVPASESCNFGKSLCAPCQGDNECGGPVDLCVRNVVSQETFCGKDCDPARNICPTPGCDPLQLEAAKNPGCPEGFSCTNLRQSAAVDARGPFQCVPDSNSCVGYCDARDEQGQIRQCGLGRECDFGGHSCRAATDGRMCAPCVDNDDCRRGGRTENRCIVNNCPDCPFKGEAFCSTPCADDAACVRSFGVGFVCRSVLEPGGTTRSFCLPQRGTCKSGLGRLGDDCSRNEAKDCVAGICLLAGLQSLCSMPCSRDAHCADTRYRCCEYGSKGYDCSPERRSADGPKSGSGVCAPTGGLMGDDCSPGRPPCQAGTCLDLGTARVCTRTCEGGCPAGFVCRKAQLAGADGGSDLEVCFPEGGGAPGADCRFGPAACESALCIRKDSGPICSQYCAGDDECPQDWTCTLVRAVDDRSVQACLPPGLQ